jgi:tripartite-type tricarboxylate transporter receptor subunit TctC
MLTLAGASLLASGQTEAQDGWPDRPIRIIVTFSPGGAPDLLTRGLGDLITSQLGYPIVVELRQGAGGNLGADLTARARPDGHTLWTASTGPLAYHHMIYPNLSFDAEKDFTYIGALASTPNIVIARPGLGFQTINDLIEHARRNPGALRYASAGIGTTQHLSGELLALMTGIELVHVPYRGGAYVVPDLLGERVDLTFGSSTSINLVREGKLTALAVTGMERFPALPEVPTVHEQGVTGYEAIAWYGLVGPAGIPEPIVRRLNTLMNEAFQNDGYRERMEQLGLYFMPSTPDGFKEFVAAERRKWSELIRKLPIAVQR